MLALPAEVAALVALVEALVAELAALLADVLALLADVAAADALVAALADSVMSSMEHSSTSHTKPVPWPKFTRNNGAANTDVVLNWLFELPAPVITPS